MDERMTLMVLLKIWIERTTSNVAAELSFKDLAKWAADLSMEFEGLGLWLDMMEDHDETPMDYIQRLLAPINEEQDNDGS
jgi:hypothetical protein